MLSHNIQHPKVGYKRQMIMDTILAGYERVTDLATYHQQIRGCQENDTGAINGISKVTRQSSWRVCRRPEARPASCFPFPNFRASRSVPRAYGSSWAWITGPSGRHGLPGTHPRKTSWRGRGTWLAALGKMTPCHSLAGWGDVDGVRRSLAHTRTGGTAARSLFRPSFWRTINSFRGRIPGFWRGWMNYTNQPYYCGPQ